MEFRVKVVLGEKKCFVMVEESWNFVSDLEKRISDLFNLSDSHLELYVDDFWLPSTEKISIVNCFDVIKVKKSERKQKVKSTQDQPSNQECSVQPKVKEVGKKQPSNQEYSVESYVQEIGKKHPSNEEYSVKPKKEKSRSQSCVSDSQSHGELLSSMKKEMLSTIDSLHCEEMDVTDNRENNLESSPKKRKRKRKHKKHLSKQPLLSFLTPELNGFPQSTTAAHASPKRAPSNPGHIRFDEDNENNKRVSDPQEEVKISNEDWQERLLSLAQEQNKKVFTRFPTSNETNGVDHCEVDPDSESEPEPELTNGSGTPATLCDNTDGLGNNDKAAFSCLTPNSLPLESAKTGHYVYFKKIMMKDCAPLVSDVVLGLIKDVEEKSTLTMRILEGSTDSLFTPEEIQDSEGEALIVKLQWNQILDPRLVTDASHLMTYL